MLAMLAASMAHGKGKAAIGEELCIYKHHCSLPFGGRKTNVPKTTLWVRVPQFQSSSNTCPFIPISWLATYSWGM